MMKYENKTSPKNITFETIYKSALAMFNYDKDKTHSWWMAKNELFDGKAPYELIKEGKGRKLMKIIDRCLI